MEVILLKGISLFAVFAACTVLFFSSAVPVYAADEKYEVLKDVKVVLSHELAADKNATTVHDAKFTFSVAGSDAKASDDPVYLVKGPDGATVTKSLTYSDEDVAAASVDENTGKKTVKKEIEVDFSNVKFADVGIYRYVVTQTLDTGSCIVTDDNSTRYIDIAVIDDGNDKLKVDSVVVRTAPDINASKSDRFTNAFTGNTLTVDMHVSGNQSSPNKYFKITVKLTKKDDTGSGDSATITNPTIRVSGPESGLSSLTSATSYSVDDINAANSIASITCKDLAEGHVFYLKNGQRLVLTDIPAGYGYTVTEAHEDYQSAVAVTGDTDYPQKSSVHVTDDMLTAYTTLAFTNTRQADVSTGVMIAVAVPALLLLTGAVGAGVILSRKRKGRQ